MSYFKLVTSYGYSLWQACELTITMIPILRMKKLSLRKYKHLKPTTQVVNSKPETMPGVTPAPPIQLCLLIYAFTQPTLACQANSRWTDWICDCCCLSGHHSSDPNSPVWTQPHGTKQVHGASCSQCTGAPVPSICLISDLCEYALLLSPFPAW